MSRADLRVAALVLGSLMIVGVLAGVLWWWLAPQPVYRVESDGLYFLSGQPQEYVASDGWFALVVVGVGAVAGVVVWIRNARHALGGLAGLMVGGLLGAGIAAAVGLGLGRADPWAAAVGTTAVGPLELRAWSVILLEAGMAVAVWLALDVLVLRPEPVTQDPIDSESTRSDTDQAGYGWPL